MRNRRCIIVVPIYKEQLSKDEEMSMQRLLDILGKHDICFMYPKSFNENTFQKFYTEHTSTWQIDDTWFESRMSYGKLCNSVDFYEYFKNLGYEYMLIYQLDCWVFRDELDYWCDKGYDYIGAPFFVRGFQENGKFVGNGGFSLRKLSSMINYINTNGPITPHFGTDDGYFAMNYNNLLKIPSKELASVFSLEELPEEQFKETTKLPFGCHAYKKYDWPFWKGKIGYDAYANLKGKITFCILTYNETDNAKLWYKRVKNYFSTYIIDTFVLDNNINNPYESDFPNDDHIILEHNVYNGGQRQIAYQKMIDDGSEWMITVNSDVQMRNEHNLSKLLSSIEKVVNSNDIGIYEVSAERGSKCQGATVIIAQNIRLYNHGTNSFRQIEEGEGWFRAVRKDVAERIYPYQNFEDNKYGWGGECHYYLAKQMGLKTVIDDTFSLYHPDGISYDNQEAAKERERFFKKFPELGIEIPVHKQANEIKTLICCIGKNENRYIREYVDWYKRLGVTNICLYDNNDVDGERFEDIIGDDINSGYVIYNDWRGKKDCQIDAYNDCYQRFGNKYDWILFIDCGDEYLELTKFNTIGEYLSMPQFVDFEVIHLNLMTVGDNGLVNYDSRPLYVRFPEEVPHNTKIAYDFPENYHVSSIVRGGRNDVIFNKVGWSHTPISDTLRCCNNVGFTVDCNSPFCQDNYTFAYFKHYTTKTAEEYVEKMKRGFPDQIWDGSRVKELIETRFFRTNVPTKEKVQVFKDAFGFDFSYLLPKKYEGEKSKDVKIYSLCYDNKNFPFIDDKYVTPLQVGAANGKDVCDLKDNTGDNISGINYFFIENTGTYWIWKNVHGAKYKGQMQYRRPMFGVNEHMDIDAIFGQYDVITCSPFYHKEHNKPTPEEPMCIPANTVEEGYGFSNCIDDLYILELVIKFYFPDYYEDYVKYIKESDRLYYSNGFILKAEDYDRYAEFLFSCLNMYAQTANIRTPDDLVNHVKYNLEVGKYQRYKTNEINDAVLRWQCSICGFLSERIWTLWVQHNFRHPRIFELPYIKMEPDKMYT